MPSLADSLAALSEHSKQISEACSHNTEPHGPFVQVQLYTSLFSLIRDASHKEVRLFKFVGEEGNGGRRIERRDGPLVTPLKKANKAEGVENLEAMLRAALKLVEDYGPMPRARSHIKDLIRTHDQHVDRMMELEELIELARQPRKVAPPPTSSPKGKAKVDIDEIIRAEEEALKALENSVASLRIQSRRSVSPEKVSPIAKAPRISVAVHTPGKTPTSSHQISNSLVSATPRRGAQPSRFSPLKLLTTPKVQKGRKSIFGRAGIRAPSGSAYTIPQIAPAVEEEEEGNETIRLASREEPPSPKPSPFKTPAKSSKVDYESQFVREGINKIQSTMPELLKDVDDPDAAIQQLGLLSESNPDAPPSPTSSASAPSQTTRLTPQTIMLAQFYLILLQSPDGTAVMNEVKEALTSIAQSRGWTDGPDLSTKVIYQSMAKKCTKIDRRGGNGGRISFAI
ncbi:hypothetical protein BD324DRAFT_649749 [Kockovaella imperatae]|uniref:Uncharacterized protein n=1 Tax=Kockovaella imperatae TaxID=4999 RepID=A0A1Y1ULG0_9TREE|nr:hypothetical protein BD324DRAFT_649749 [Kockovaella imperatae]ORX38377.1 hypothetical protein BD324DRAFT_649749 [Kockovaella imperatae]